MRIERESGFRILPANGIDKLVLGTLLRDHLAALRGRTESIREDWDFLGRLGSAEDDGSIGVEFRASAAEGTSLLDQPIVMGSARFVLGIGSVDPEAELNQANATLFLEFSLGNGEWLTAGTMTGNRIREAYTQHAAQL